MSPGGFRGALRAAAVASVMALGVFLPVGAGLGFGPGAESPSAARQAPPAEASPRGEWPSAQARRAALVEELSRITSRRR